MPAGKYTVPPPAAMTVLTKASKGHLVGLASVTGLHSEVQNVIHASSPVNCAVPSSRIFILRFRPQAGAQRPSQPSARAPCWACLVRQLLLLEREELAPINTRK